MNKIKEYRRKSADIIFLNQFPWAKPLYKFTSLFWPSWTPDEDANQREMIENWLLKKGIQIYYFMESENEIWVRIIDETSKHEACNETIETDAEKSKSIAFMKAFMEYKNYEEKNNLKIN